MSEIVSATEYPSLEHEETVARSAIYPKARGEDGKFSINRMLDPTKDPKSDKDMPTYGISVASRKLLGSNDNIHLYGCRTAAKQNEAAIARAREKNKPVPERRYYLGFYEVEVGALLLAASENCKVIVVLKPEGGEDAHCEVIISPTETSNRDAYRQARTDALIEIAGRLSQPERHVCECDEDKRDELSKIELPTPLHNKAPGASG